MESLDAGAQILGWQPSMAPTTVPRSMAIDDLQMDVGEWMSASASRAMDAPASGSHSSVARAKLGSTTTPVPGSVETHHFPELPGRRQA